MMFYSKFQYWNTWISDWLRNISCYSQPIYLLLLLLLLSWYNVTD